VKVSNNLEETRKYIHEILPMGKSFDLIEREFLIGGEKSYMYFIDGFAKDGVLTKMIAFLFSITPEKMKNIKTASEFAANFIPYVETDIESDMDKIIQMYLSGATVLFVDNFTEAIVIDARTYPARGVEEPEKEKVLRGSRDGFVETVVFNTALMRRRIKDPNFTAEIVTVGRRSKTDIVLTYIKDLVDEKMLNEMKTRLKNIDVRSLTMNQESLAECLIRKKWYNPFPKVRYTERPDIAAACVLEGSIALLVDNDPSALLLPSSIFDFIQEADDFYYPPVVGGYMRIVRNLVFFSTLILTPLWLLLIENLDSNAEYEFTIRLKDVIGLFSNVSVLKFSADNKANIFLSDKEEISGNIRYKINFPNHDNYIINRTGHSVVNSLVGTVSGSSDFNNEYLNVEDIDEINNISVVISFNYSLYAKSYTFRRTLPLY